MVAGGRKWQPHGHLNVGNRIGLPMFVTTQGAYSKMFIVLLVSFRNLAGNRGHTCNPVLRERTLVVANIGGPVRLDDRSFSCPFDSRGVTVLLEVSTRRCRSLATRAVMSFTVFAVFLAATSLVLYGQADRGSITGIVTDSQRAELPNTPVQITNSDTGVVTTVRTSSAGNYSSPPMIIGNYDVRVEAPGFKVFSARGIRLDSGQTFRQDVVLELGSVSESVDVKANSEQLNTENPQVSASITQQYYTDLPAISTGNIRVPEALLFTVPGFTPRQGQGDQFFSRINGGQAAAFENFLDGASYGEVVGHNFTAERSAPFESIQEARVIQNTFSAQYGHTSGGFVEYTTKSGTSRFHGAAYEYFQNNVLNARGEIARTPPVLRQNNYGVAVGGPIWIPKVYNGKNKSFFFYNYDGYKFRNSGDAGFLTVAPTDFRQGNFSSLLGTLSGQLDACGRQVRTGQIFDPLSTRDASTCGGPARRENSPPGGIPAGTRCLKQRFSHIRRVSFVRNGQAHRR